MIRNLSGGFDFCRKKCNGHSKNVCQVFVNFPLSSDVQVMPFYLSCRPGTVSVTGGHKCHINIQRILLMIIFVL